MTLLEDCGRGAALQGTITLQELVQVLAPVLGLETNAVNFNPGTDELTFHIKVNQTFAPTPIAMVFEQA